MECVVVATVVAANVGIVSAAEAESDEFGRLPVEFLGD